MNRLPLFVLCALTAAAGAAPIALTGSMQYTQSFDVLDTQDNGSTSLNPWDDDGTIPGWYLYKAGATAAGPVGTGYIYRVSDGIPGVGNANGLVNTGHFYSIGALGSNDRALGAVPITAQGEHSVIAVFQNAGLVPIRLQTIAYNVEIRRTNQNANVVETLAVWWKTGPDPAAFLVNTTATATATDWPASVSTGPSGQYVTGWNRAAEADFTTSSPDANLQVDVLTPVNAPVLSEIKVNPGEYLAVRWGNINDSGADALMGIDDVDLTFVSDDGGISGAVSNVVRHDAGTPRDPADDTVSFDLTVSGAGAVGPGWSITSPAALAGTGGPFGVPVSIPAQPIASFAGTSHVLSLVVADQSNPAITAPVQVVAPWCQITPAAAAGFSYDDKGTASLADDEVTYSLLADGVFTGDGFDITVAGLPIAAGFYGVPYSYTAPAPGTYTSFTFVDRADPACTATLEVFPPAILGTNATTLSPRPLFSLAAGQNGATQWNVLTTGTVQQTAVTLQIDHVLFSETVDLSAVSEDVEFTATLAAVTGTSSGFEAADSFALDLIIDGDTANPVSALGLANDTDGDGRLRGALELQTTVNTTRTFDFSYVIPATASSVQIRITGNSNSAAETFNLTALSLAIPQPGISLTPASNIIRNFNNPGSADDTVSFDVTITGVNGGTGWITSDATPASGAFGFVTLTVPAGGTSATVRITDNTFPGAFADLTVPLPGPYIIGSFDPGTGPLPVFTDEATPPDAGWVIDAAAGTLNMTNGNAAFPLDSIVTSEVIDLTTAAGPLTFSANLHVQDRTSGFEDPDTFLAVLVLNGDTANPIRLTDPYDTDLSGRMNGAELCPVPAVNPTVQDFDYPLSAAIPAGTLSAQLIVTGFNNSANETMIVSGIRFAVAAADTDGDGMSDEYEDDNGLDKTSPADRDLDADGDGQSNYLESVAGTAANNAASLLHITGGTFDAASGAAVTEWSSVPGKRYRLQFSDTLTGWTDTGSVITATGPVTSASYTVPGAPLTGKGFVRVKVVP